MQLNLLEDDEVTTTQKNKRSVVSKTKQTKLLSDDLFAGLLYDAPENKSDSVILKQAEEVIVAEQPKKSETAFKTISEVASIFSVPQHVLRFWESKFSQIKPLKMGGGRRYYRPEDVDIIRRIYNLLYKQGYTIKGAKKALSAKDVQALEIADIDSTAPALTEKQKKQVSSILQELLNSREVLKSYITDKISA